MDTTTPITLFWFRRDLRLQDNIGLFNALKENNNVLPIFIFDTQILGSLNKDDKRVSYIYNTVSNLHSSLKEMGTTLLVLNGESLVEIKKLTQLYNIKAVYTNHDYEPFAIKRDASIHDYLNTQSIAFKTYKDHVIFEKNEVLKKDNLPYTVFTPYAKVWKKKLDQNPIAITNLAPFYSNFYKTIPSTIIPIQALGFVPTLYEMPILNLDPDTITNYEQTRNYPYLSGTSQISVALRFGTISIRAVVQLAVQYSQKWLDELIWREFYIMILYHFPKVERNNFKSKYDNLEYNTNENDFINWCNGTTGYPIVDAGMRQLNATGLMHNRVRMIVASFLTKQLLINWQWGEAYFATKLLDYELASNNGNWQWAAGTGCDAAPYFRIFNPQEQIKKFDPKFVYCKKWLPDWNEFSYPNPIIDLKYARERTLEAYKKCLAE